MAGTQRGRRRGRWLLVLVAVAAGLAVWGYATLRALDGARRDAEAGIDTLEQVRGSLTPTGLARGEGIDELRAAQADFDRAGEAVGSPVVAPLRVLPVVGRQVRSVEALAGAASEVVAIGVAAAEDSRTELERDIGVPQDRVELTRAVSDIAERSVARLEAIDLGPDRALLEPLRDARDRLERELGTLTSTVARVGDASEGLAEFLQGPGTYLVLAANNNEMRVGSGAPLSAGVLTVRDGELDLGPMEATVFSQLPEGAVTLEGDLADRWGFLEPEREWRNLGASPRFETQAELAARMWEALGRGRVDGVLVLDPVALQALLRGTGPVEVDGGSVSADDVLEELYLRQYEGVDLVADTIARRDRLSAIARATVGALNRGGWDAAGMLDELGAAARGRHVLAWSRDPKVEAGWAAAGTDGVLEADSLMLGVHNRGGNKLDQFLAVDAELAVEPTEGSSQVSVRTTLTNNAPEPLPSYVTGPYPGASGGAEGRYQGLLVAQVPATATDVAIVDEAGTPRPLVAAGADGPHRVVAAYVELDRGESATDEVRFTLPGETGTLKVEPSARVPAIRWTTSVGPGATWDDGEAHQVTW